jgi:hypothetical protein
VFTANLAGSAGELQDVSGWQRRFKIRPMTTYNREQWISSFEGRLSILRPHLTPRLLNSMSLSACHTHGTKGEDPIKAASAWSASMDQPKK